MMLQISTPINGEIPSSFLDNQLLFVILGLIALVFVIIRVAKFLSEMDFNRTSK
ncbi:MULTISPECIES: hypothetical protein [unclassified Polaribacter]|uniref:hypothetical protein n=1 Tax=unclassified Polaribacter TaxID=196858 RepID=UPI001C4FFE1E|nr:MULTISPECIES: hypothetical protein [unclassified Polaribacter]QXP66472.1 hypothetical protein H0I28_15080 [Polaribacter sp. AHE13PA]QXP71955.1 hypothetical protein H0I29_07790 [Polaribacter sp. R2A056_3_33]